MLTLQVKRGITGTEGDDNLVGSTGDDIIQGLGGNDTIEGGGGNDTLYGGGGDDAYLFGIEFGTDAIVDASGLDSIHFLNSYANVVFMDVFDTDNNSIYDAIKIRFSNNDEVVVHNFFNENTGFYGDGAVYGIGFPEFFISGDEILGYLPGF